MKFKLISSDDLEFRVKLLNHPQVISGITIDSPVTLMSTEKWFSSLEQKKHTRYDFVFFDQNNQKTGFCGLVNIEHKHKLAELYIFIDPKKHKNGYGTKALKWLLSFAKFELNLRKIVLYVTNNNKKALNLYEKLGFQQEAKLLKHIWYRGMYVDRLIYSIFLDENELIEPYTDLL